MKTYILIISLILSVLSTAVMADVPPVISYQGKLMQPNGNPIPDGTYSIHFAIYDAPTGGDALWGETNSSVQVKGGLFAVLLGSVNNLGANILDSQNRYLGIKVGSDAELAPRQRIASVATALRAGEADVAKTVLDGAITTSKLADAAVTTDKLASNSVTSGSITDQAVGTSKIADLAVTEDKISDGSVTPEKVTKRITRQFSANGTTLTQANTWYDVISTTIVVSKPTTVTIFASAAMQNNATANVVCMFRLDVDGSTEARCDTTLPVPGIGEQRMVATALILQPGSHVVKIKASSWTAGTAICGGDPRTQLVVVEG
jgi:hypothetical protein